MPNFSIYSFSPLNVVDSGNLLSPMLFPQLPTDGPFFRLLFEFFSKLTLCCWALGFEPLEGLVYVASYMLGAIYLNLLCISEQKILFIFYFSE